MAGNKVGLNKELYAQLVGPKLMPDPLARALAIASVSLGRAKTWNGESYARHWLQVADVNNEDLDLDAICAGILHDVVEDSDVTLEDLRAWGFSDRIVQIVDNVTKRDGEKYFDCIVNRVSTDRISRHVKKRDNRHNMDQTRSYTVQGKKQQHIYPISHLYLDSVDTKRISPLTPIWQALSLFEKEIPHLQAGALLSKERVLVIAAETSDPIPENLCHRFEIKRALCTKILAPSP